MVNRTTNDTSYIITIASVDTAGTEARILVLMSSTSSNELIRIVANKSTGVFAYNWVSSESSNNDFNTIFIRTADATAAKAEAYTGGSNTASGSNQLTSHSGCVLPTNPNSAATGSCAALGTFPEVATLGATAVWKSEDLADSAATIRTAIQSARDVSFASLAALK